MVRKDQNDKKFPNLKSGTFADIGFCENFSQFRRNSKKKSFDQKVSIGVMKKIILNSFYYIQLFRKMRFTMRF